MRGANAVSLYTGQGRIHRWAIMLVVIGCLLVASLPSARAQWRSLRVDHFYVHYPSARSGLAADVALRAEAVHDLLTARVNHTPETRTHIVLWDGMHLANGFATPVFENQIGLYLTLPSLADQYLAGFGPAAPDDWLTLLLLHEYAHILHVDMRSEAAERVMDAFGRVPFVVSPLILAPPLVLEGFAVYQESLDGGGRGNGTYYDMFLRTAVLEDRVPRIDQVLGEYPLGRWQPGGHVYFFGYNFMAYLARQYGPEFLIALNEELVRRPDSLAVALQKLTDRSLEALWADWLEDVTERSLATVERLTGVQATPVEMYDTVGYHTFFPTPSPDGTAIAYVAVGGTGSELRLLNTATGKERHVSDVEALLTTTIAWHPRGDVLVVAAAQEELGGFWVTQLVEIELATGNMRRIPGTRHAVSPTFDGTGERIAYIRRDALTTELRLLDRSTGEDRLLELPGEVTLFAVRWSPTSDVLALSAWDEQRGGYLALYDVETESFMPILGGGSVIYDPPSWSPEGDVLLFASDRSGIFNIYTYELGTRRLSRQTHTVTGLFYPMASRSGTVSAMVYTADGYRLARIAEFQPQPAGPLWLPRPATMPIPGPQRAVDITELGRYNSWFTLRPTFWLPTAGYSAGESHFHVLTAGRDVLGRTAYTATIGASITSGQPLYDIEWQQSLGERTGLALRLQARRAPLLLAMDDEWLPYDGHSGALELEWRRPVDHGAYSFRIAVERFGAEPRQAGEPPVRKTELAVGASHLSVLSYFDWRLNRELHLEARAEPYDRDGWSVRIGRVAQLEHALGLGVVGKVLGAATGAGKDVYLGAGGQGDVLNLTLRGYSAVAYQGNVAWAGSLEGSIPLVGLNRGISDVPLFLKDVRLHPFVEGGWTRAFGAEQGASAFSFGAELGLRTYLGFGATGVDWRLGIARGAGEPGPRLYLRMGSNF